MLFSNCNWTTECLNGKGDHTSRHFSYVRRLVLKGFYESRLQPTAVSQVRAKKREKWLSAIALIGGPLFFELVMLN